MDIIRTKVFVKVDRSVALAVLQSDFGQAMPMLFSLADKRNGSVSGTTRLLKYLTSEYSGIRSVECPTTSNVALPTISNYADRYAPLNEADVETCILGFGTRFPCNYAWIMSVTNLDVFLRYFSGKSEPVNQNSYLPGTCNAFCFGVFGVVALAAKILNRDGACDEIRDDDPLLPFQTKSWSYLHFKIDEDERRKIANMLKSVGAEVKRSADYLASSVKSKGNDIASKNNQGSRVTLSPIAKKHFKRMGYTWNKSESEPKVTVFDKVTDRGNIVRITADAGGHNELIPYIDAKFISSTFVSPESSVVGVNVVSSEAELSSLLERHESDLHYYEENIAAIYDQELGDSHPTITKLLQTQSIRQIQ